MHNISPLLNANPAALGTIDLRGDLVPLHDLEVVSGLPGRKDTPRIAAILRHRGETAAIALDEIVDFKKANPIPLKQEASKIANTTILPTGFLLKSETVSCLDVVAFFRSEKVISITPNRHSEKEVPGGYLKLLIISGGGAHFAIDAIKIQATIPLRKIDTDECSGGLFLGFIRHQGWKVPVVDGATVLGLGHAARRSEAKIVILRFPGELLLGLAVDEMDRIASVPEADIEDSNPMVQIRGLLPWAFVDKAQRQIHIVDMDALTKVPELLELSGLSSRLEQQETPVTSDGEASGTALRENARYLVYQSGVQVASPITDVVRILPAPRDLVPAGNDIHPCVRGFFGLDSRSVPFVDIEDRVAEAPAFTLLVGPPGREVGFAVDRIHSVQSSRWRFPEKSGQDGTIIELGQGEAKKVLPLVDLAAIAEGLTAGAP